MKSTTKFPLHRLTCALLLSLSASPAAWAINIDYADHCYSEPKGASGHDFYLVNNSPSNLLKTSGPLEGMAGKYTGPNFYPGPYVNPLQNSGGCVYYNSVSGSTYEGGQLQLSIGGYSFTVNLAPKDGEPGNLLGGYSITLWSNSGWTTSGACPGYSAVSAVNNDQTQTICNSDYIVAVTTTAANAGDESGRNGAVLLINDNPTGAASGTQTTGGSSSASASGNPQTRSLAGAGAQPQAASGRHDLASRFVNNRRWSVIHNAETGTFSGMSYAADGLQHDQFVHCTFASDDGNADVYARQSTYTCHVAAACTDGQCGADTWQVLPENVTLPGTFFNRPDANPADPAPEVPPVGGDRDIRLGLAELPTVTERKIHQTPDGQFKVISANLRGYEWLLTYNGAKMFGVVPRGLMEQPRFLHCQQTAETPRNVTLDCAEAYRCHFGPCTADRWTPVSSVTVPRSFFSLSGEEEPQHSSGGGGCVLTPNAPFDPLFPALSLGALWYLIRRRRQA